MEWRTELNVKEAKNKIGYSDPIFTIGSCFSDELGQQLIENKFLIWKNRFGTVYNPISIHRLLQFGLQNQLPASSSYLNHEDVFLNYDFHSSVSSLNKNDLEQKVQNLIAEASLFLKSTKRIVITYGTAFVYKLKSSGEIVANCHKQPSALFEKCLLTENEIVESFGQFYSRLTQINPNARIILTVSPVRHLKDTLELNSVSKSILRVACHTLTNRFPNVDYFPAYEILLDDLRDYRFFKTDRIHPIEEAAEYIWQKFADAYFDEPTKKFISEWKKIKADLNHKPFHVESASHQKFLQSLLLKLESLKSLMDVKNEIEMIKSQIVQ
ncbi:MAG TPA: hypothetical protein DGG95_08650 [Cytophagales bacterium]|jgi:hypothetical protein|nr:hypothetical protein [Cytophagales bacterium]